jgi:hypothetical protein
MILSASVAAASDTGTELGIFDKIREPVISFDSGDNAFFDVNFEEAAPTAVMRGTACPDHTFGGCCFNIGFSDELFALLDRNERSGS